MICQPIQERCGDMAYDDETGSESLRSALCRVYPEQGTD